MPLYDGQHPDVSLEIGQGDIIVLVGASPGQVLQVSQWITGQQLVVFAPDPEQLAGLRAAGDDSAALVVATDETQLHDLLARHLVYTPGRRVALMAPPEYRESHPHVVKQAAKVVEQVVTWAEINHATARDRVGQWLDHLVANCYLLAQLPDVTLLSGQLSHVPAIIVGAGPSIDESLADLAWASQRGVVLAAASALGPMARAGLQPHIVLASEALDESRQFVGDGLAKAFLAAASTAHPNHFLKWPGPQGMFHLYPWLSQMTGGQSLPTGGHITSAAFSLATIWDCNPIILLGQDLAHTGGRTYGTGTVGAPAAPGDAEIAVAAIGGGTVPTTMVMHTYRLWYEEAVRIFQGKWPGKRFINATKAGAYIEGFEYCSINDALADNPCFINGPDPIFRVLGELPRPSRRELAEHLKAAADGIDEVRAILKAQGPEAAIEACDHETVAGFAMQNLAQPNPDAEALALALDRMQSWLAKMAEL